MLRVFVTCRSRSWLWSLALVGLLMLLSSCGDSTPSAKPATWTNYQGKAFVMNYFSSWGVATKDLYLGTSYPQLEMLQGMAFTSPESATTFVQVVYAENTDGKASVSDLLRKYILGTLKQPVAASSLTKTTLAGETWSQGVIEKQVSTNNASTVLIKKAALGVNHVVNANKKEIYLIIYQDETSSFDKTAQDFFTRMVNSFRFGS